MEYLILNGKQIPYTRGMIPISACGLDPKNPRIQYLVSLRTSKLTDDELDALLWDKDSVKELSLSIKQNGGVIEHIIVQRKGDKFIVREGNSRVVALRHLAQQHPTDSRYQQIPAMVFDVELGNEDLAVLLSEIHVAGKTRWDAYEQAKHVSDLYNVYGKSYEWLSNHLRLSKTKIVELLSAYNATSEFLASHKAPENIKKFSLFHELMKRRWLKDNFQNSNGFKQKFHRWLLEARLSDAKQIRHLETILSNTEAEMALNSKGYDEAVAVLYNADPSMASNHFWAIRDAAEKLKSLPANDIQDIKNGNAQKIMMIRSLKRTIEDLETLTGTKI